MKRLYQISILVGVFLSCLIAISYYFYFDLKKQYLIESEKTKDNTIAQVRDIVQKSSVDFDLKKFEYSMDTLIQNSLLEGVKVEFTNFEFSNETIFSKVDILDESWRILDVTTDIAAGEITNLLYGEYFFVPADGFDFNTPVDIKFQATKGGFIRDFTISLPFVFEIGSVDKSSFIETQRYNLYYEMSEIDIASLLNETFKKFMLMLTLLLCIVMILFYLLYQKVLKGKLYQSIEQIDRFVANMLKKNFQNPDELQFGQKELNSLLDKITTLSKQFAQTVNELNVSRDIIEKKEITDDLTGLPNKKWFEKDLKHMFVTNKGGYIIYLKMDKLGEFTKQHGGEIVNSLVEDFAKLVEEFFISHREFDGRFYRFFGAEFAMILYIDESNKVEKVLDQLISQTRTLDERYYFFDNNIYYGGTPFDKYGTVESILQSAKEEYQSAYSSKENFYKISDLSDQIQKNKELEKSVRDIIERDDFALQYVYDTYDFAATPNLIMQEITPMLIDMRTFDRFPVGVFISVAEKINLASEFDKLLIKKALSHIEMGELEHKIAINLSVGSFTSMRFITWLSSIMNYEKGAKNLVFVITAYSAAGNFDQYKRFVDTIVEFEAQVMLKRFDLNDFSLEQLKLIKPHFIRIERDYCNDIKRDTTKQHKIKQVLLFAEEYGVKVLGDSVKNDVDYQTLEKLGFYGTSR